MIAELIIGQGWLVRVMFVCNSDHGSRTFDPWPLWDSTVIQMLAEEKKSWLASPQGAWWLPSHRCMLLISAQLWWMWATLWHQWVCFRSKVGPGALLCMQLWLLVMRKRNCWRPGIMATVSVGFFKFYGLIDCQGLGPEVTMPYPQPCFYVLWTFLGQALLLLCCQWRACVILCEVLCDYPWRSARAW